MERASQTTSVAPILSAMSVDQWALLLNPVTLFVIPAAASAALVPWRHFWAQSTLDVDLPARRDRNDPDCKALPSKHRAADSASLR
jgi:hypothetical protein